MNRCWLLIFALILVYSFVLFIAGELICYSVQHS